jgi:predicted transcriptional regulator
VTSSEDDEQRSPGGGDVALQYTAEIVASFVRNNALSTAELADLIRLVHKTLTSLSRGESEAGVERPKPAVAIAKSVHADYIVCLEDGRKLKTLKRHLRSTYDMSTEEYRKRWGLPPDYPMVAPNYAARRSEFAKKIGLGKGVRRKS